MRRPSRSARLDSTGGGGADLITFWLEPVVLDPLDADRLKRAVSDMESELRDLHASRDAAIDERRCEMKTGGRCGD